MEVGLIFVLGAFVLMVLLVTVTCYGMKRNFGDFVETEESQPGVSEPRFFGEGVLGADHPLPVQTWSIQAEDHELVVARIERYIREETKEVKKFVDRPSHGTLYRRVRAS